MPGPGEHEFHRRALGEQLGEPHPAADLRIGRGELVALWQKQAEVAAAALPRGEQGKSDAAQRLLHLQVKLAELLQNDPEQAGQAAAVYRAILAQRPGYGPALRGLVGTTLAALYTSESGDRNTWITAFDVTDGRRIFSQELTGCERVSNLVATEDAFVVRCDHQLRVLSATDGAQRATIGE